MDKKAFFAAALGVAVGATIGAAVSVLVRKLQDFKFELAPFPIEDEEEDLENTSAVD